MVYVIDYVSNIVREWAALLSRYVVMGTTRMEYEIGSWAAPHRQCEPRALCTWGSVYVTLVTCGLSAW